MDYESFLKVVLFFAAVTKLAIMVKRARLKTQEV